MRLSSLFLTLAAFVIAGALAIVAAYFSSRLIEDASIVGVQSELDREGLTWATVDANGLQVFLAGNAPTEADRFQAVSAAGRVVDAARVLDQMTVTESEGLTPPRFSVEILRNDAGLSLIGLIPAKTDRAELLDRIQRKVGRDVPVSDFLEGASFDAPASWDDALEFALSTLGDLPRSKISVEIDKVSVTAMAGSGEEKRRLEADLVRRTPPDVKLALDLTAPRPVITPFTLRFVIDEDGARFDACSADTEDSRTRILAAAAAIGLQDKADCRIGLGVPTRRWAEAVELSLNALARLGGDSVTISDADISLIAREDTDPDLYDQVIGELENALPPVFALTAVLPETPDVSDQGPPEFTATLSPEGAVALRGRINSDIARVTAESFAQARFGSGVVRMAARVDDSLTPAWSVRVLAGLEALAELNNGAVIITPDLISVTGNTGNPTATDEIAALLAEKLGEGQDFEINVTYLEKLDPVLGIPTPEECEAQIVEVIGDRKITFEPGSATLDASAKDIMDEVAELLKLCGDIPLEIQGHTDSQGRESMNLDLSQARAEAVLQALLDRRIPTSAYTAKGYGEANPIADNGTEEGREANRRIEFRLIRPAPAQDSTTTLESLSQTGQDTGNADDTGTNTDAADTATDQQGTNASE
ncbi:OmpA family protein [Mesobacterium sp. TK19101]|uniref:OmpA family protein n=1 Tax=Mesobacterium hydrothermale TaxID=3111907 RepID=A0ABU6HCC2_9RHOB|nr:OmpA family protein [Mesobacterium sp. TK19101]MEC3859782.1 OmpA family protein [Mesobacterium sp. TK19101]